jgi:hypothetical protein
MSRKRTVKCGEGGKMSEQKKEKMIRRRRKEECVE